MGQEGSLPNPSFRHDDVSTRAAGVASHDKLIGQDDDVEAVQQWSLASVYQAIPDRAKGLAMLNTLTVLMACNWFLVKDVQEQMDPFGFTALRFVLAALAFAPVFKRAAAEAPHSVR